MSIISLNIDITERVEIARQAINNNAEPKGWYIYSEREFLNFVFMQGLLKIEFETLPKLTGKPYEVYKRYA